MDDSRSANPDDLEYELIRLGESLDWPDEPNLAPSIRARLNARSVPRRPWWTLLAPPRRAVAFVSLAIALVAALLLVTAEPVRTTVADRLGLPGVAISTNPTASISQPVAGEMQLGERVTLEHAREQVEFVPAAPPEDVLGPPDEVYVLERPVGMQISYVYVARDDLPAVGDSGVGLLIVQFEGQTNESFIRKQLGPGTTLELVDVNGTTGFWIEGAPHVFYYEDPSGAIQDESIRLAGNVLLWHQHGRTLRIESSLSKEEALRVAMAIR
jgi:hypothetical protein